MGLFRRKIGLALGAGGAKGVTHIGVLKALEQKNICIDYIAGTSIGALVGGLYALTKDIVLIESIFYRSQTKEFVESFSDPSLTSGLLKGDKVLNLFSEYIKEDTLIEDTQIPFAVVTTDLKSGKRVVLKSGNLKQAIRASISLPVIFSPVEYEDYLLVDGGLVEPVPIQAVKEMGAQKIIAVNLYSQHFVPEENKSLSLIDVAKSSIDIALKSIAERDMESADVQLNMPIKNIPLTTLAKDPSEYIKLGYETTIEQIKQLRRL